MARPLALGIGRPKGAAYDLEWLTDKRSFWRTSRHLALDRGSGTGLAAMRGRVAHRLGWGGAKPAAEHPREEAPAVTWAAVAAVTAAAKQRGRIRDRQNL